MKQNCFSFLFNSKNTEWIFLLNSVPTYIWSVENVQSYSNKSPYNFPILTVSISIQGTKIFGSPQISVSGISPFNLRQRVSHLMPVLNFNIVMHHRPAQEVNNMYNPLGQERKKVTNLNFTFMQKKPTSNILFHEL